ncbi:thiamine pyrophosphate-dependent dehydrogenase E1 component subunit alpha [Geothrix sp. PMB-07]|uniref:thiamine pyrophosphate-dependent dehydrogenase E1 component subunit alpha n=1 Tax=Geothrix sp. PMB-07 TaxID=3068640 RepID=UPI002741B699|nr:thiamine pyrophosphate-dependent dehydrogenase E1 component subunit alpha [Geothrix sp. PMB-07]WLT30053.1 thiamine pyrophosphate-dependent dehydrogenase E1 component subunit alpha [Geothrix sp. PMB-07]
MLLTRLTEERLVKLFRQGQTLGSVYRSLGQEATACATAMALGPEDVIAPMIRNLGSMFVRGVTPKEIFLQYLGRATGPSGGREHNNHFGSVARGIIAPTSMLGALIPVMAGVALSFRQKGERRVAMTWIGDGGSSTGAFYEGLNFATVQNLPLIVVGESNGYAFSTPPERQMAGRMSQRSQGAFTLTVDGNDAVAVYEAAAQARQRCLEGQGPVFLVCETFRMKGHAEHDDQRYVDPALLAQWATKDPLPRFEAWMAHRGWKPDPSLGPRLEARLSAAAEAALEAPWPTIEGLSQGIFSI